MNNKSWRDKRDAAANAAFDKRKNTAIDPHNDVQDIFLEGYDKAARELLEHEAVRGLVEAFNLKSGSHSVACSTGRCLCGLKTKAEALSDFNSLRTEILGEEK